MRRLLLVLTIVAALATVLGAAACGTASKSAALAGDQTPQGILAASMEAASTISSAQADFDLSLSFDVDSSTVPAEELSLVGQPMKVTGHAAVSSEPQALDLSLDGDLAGQAMKVGLKMSDDKAYLGLEGQWYEAPADLQQTLGAGGMQAGDAEAMEKTFDELGLDPSTWMKDVRQIGEETVDGKDAYHLQATPDLAAIMADVFKLMQSEQFAAMTNQAVSGANTTGSEQIVPALEGLEAMQTQLPQMFRTLTMDIWVDKDSLNPVKIAVNAEMTPPAGEDSGGINAITLAMSIILSDINEPVDVEAPASPQSWDAFQKAIETNPGLLGPLGALSGAAALGGGTTTETSIAQ